MSNWFTNWFGGGGSDSNGDSSSQDIKIEGADINPELQPGSLMSDMDKINGTTNFLGHEAGSGGKGDSKGDSK